MYLYSCFKSEYTRILQKLKLYLYWIFKIALHIRNYSELYYTILLINMYKCIKHFQYDFQLFRNKTKKSVTYFVVIHRSLITYNSFNKCLYEY